MDFNLEPMGTYCLVKLVVAHAPGQRRDQLLAAVGQPTHHYIIREKVNWSPA